MKRFIALACCSLIFSVSFAQKKTAQNDAAMAERKLVASGRCELAGVFRDAHNRSIAGVEAFIYAKDSSIAASGYSDSTGHFETNSVLPGIYTIKIVYPAAKTMMITAVPMKKGYTPLNIKADAPTADTTQSYAELVPKVETKKGGKTVVTKTTTTTTTTKVTTTTTPPPAAKK